MRLARAGQYATGQHATGQHGTGQNGACQQGIAQHSACQHRSGGPSTRGRNALLAAFLAIAVSLAGSPAALARDWLDLRRAGPAAILADARRSSAPQPWSAVYAVALPAQHPLSIDKKNQSAPKELRLTVLRLPLTEAAPKGATPLGRWMVRFDAPPSLAGVGVVADGRELWLRLPDGKVEAATPARLAQVVAGLQMPLQVFALSELVGVYDYELEGEFGDSGVIRCKPSYRSAAGLSPGKLGVHKRWGSWTLMEVNDRDGKRLAHAEWLEFEDRSGVPVPSALRLRPTSGDQASLTLTRRAVSSGAALAKELSPKALR